MLFLNLTNCRSISISLIVGFVDKNIASVIHSVKLHELMHQLKCNQTFWRLVNFLAERVFPEESAVLAIFGLLLFNDLQRLVRENGVLLL